MRRRVVFAVITGSFVASAIACVDLFHSTSDVKSLCEMDASDPRCLDGGDAAPQDLCAPDAGAAQTRAMKACAMLSACAHPAGHNKTGECMVDAILAYDCAANPNRKPIGKTKAFWLCMQNAQTCADVVKCVYPQSTVQCGNGGFIGCSQAIDPDSGTRVDPDTRVDCYAAANPAPGENCASHGQTCDSLSPDASNNDARCLGPKGRVCTGTGGCVGTQLSVCDDAGFDNGYDCADFGAGSCYTLGASTACKPTGTGTCASTNDVTCTAGNVVAQGCVTGIPETVDCTAISGKGTCVPIDGGGLGTTPASACHLDTGCADDTCDDAGALVACVRGRSVVIDCTKLGLKTCNPINTADSPTPIAACNAP